MQKLKPDLIEYISILKKDVKINNYDIISKLDNKIKPNRNTKKNVWIEAYGCSANIADSEIIAGTLNSHGYNIVHCIDESDLNIIVTCSVKDSTEHKMLHRIKQLTVDNKPLLVAGCLTKTERKKIEKINPNVSLLGPNSLDRSVEAVNLTFSNYKIGVGMLNPMYLSEILYDLILVYKNEEKIFKFLHIPVQSGSNKILKQMYRGHDIKIFKKAVYEFRKSIPEITIATDVIVGFPNETEEDFKLTMDLIKEYEPDIINISKYSQRSGTVSSRLKNIPSDQKKLRSTILHSISREISKKRNTLWKGWIGNVYIDEITNTLVQGRNYAYKSVIINNSDTLNLSVGQIIKVKVVDSSQYSLFAEFLEFK